MNRLAVATRTALVASLLALPGCFVAPSPDTVAAIDAVESALASPTGELGATNAAEVLAISSAKRELDRTSAYTQHLADGFGQAPQGTQSASASCKTTYEGGGSLDIGCASGGTASGTVSYEISMDDSGQYVVLKYDAVCTESVCVDGTASTRISSYTSETDYKMVGSASIDISEAGVTVHAEYGYRAVAQGGETVTEWVVFDDGGASFVLSAVVTADKGEVTVRDQGGELSCVYEQGGETGSCTGPTTTFAW